MTSSDRLLSPEEIAVQAGRQIPFLRLPERASVYAEREMRLRQRAASSPMRDFLLFVAEVARAQHALLRAHPGVPLPDAAALDIAARAGLAPLPAALWPRDAAWRAGFATLIETLSPRVAGTSAAGAVAALRGADDQWLEQQADRLLNGVMVGLDLAAAPLVAAALQAHWTHLVTATAAANEGSRTAAFGRVDDATRCPCCASRPTASISRIGADAAGYRYLHCSLCATQWHMVRIKCSHCEQTQGIHYESLSPAGEGGDAGARKAAVEAETCDACGHYLKIVHMERDPEVDPIADDLASVTLDLLVSEAGFERHGVNLMLLFGDPDAPAEPDGGGG